MQKVQDLIASNKKNIETVKEIMDLIKSEEGFYAIKVRITNNFYQGAEDGQPASFVFTNELFAADFVKELAFINMEAKYIDIKPEQRLGFFGDLARSGIEKVVIDRNHESFTFDLSHMIDMEKAMEGVVNPNLMVSAAIFYQCIAKGDVVEQMQDQLSREIYNATFLIPSGASKFGTHPMLANGKGENFYPIFTDRYEFAKFDRKNKYGAEKIKFKDIKGLFNGSAGIVINPFGFGLKIDEVKYNRIKSENSSLKVVK